RGLNFFVQTIACRDCRELYDAVVRLRFAPGNCDGIAGSHLGLWRSNLLNRARIPKSPPAFQAALNRLIYADSKPFKWVQFSPQCPVSPLHRVRAWNEPDKCPRCGLFLERNAIPYRIWD